MNLNEYASLGARPSFQFHFARTSRQIYPNLLTQITIVSKLREKVFLQVQCEKSRLLPI